MADYRIETQFTGGKDIAVVEESKVFDHCIDLLSRGAVACDVLDSNGYLVETLEDYEGTLIVNETTSR